MEKPNKLYRGISVDHKIFEKLDLNGKLTPPNPPKINEKGQKTVNDGNEYGVYMTDNELMARDAYGKCHQLGLKVGGIRGGERYEIVAMPQIGIVYEINTENLDVHKPWITPELEGHYNNGFGGDEWVADEVPASNIKITRVMVGQDTLNPAIIIDVNKSASDIKEEVNEILKKREKGLNLFMESVGKLSRGAIIGNHDVFVAIYGEDGIALNSQYDNSQTPKAIIRNTMIDIYKKDPDNLDLRKLKYLHNLNKAYTSEKDNDALMENVSRQIEMTKSGLEKQKERGIDTRIAEENLDFFQNLQNKFENVNLKAAETEGVF